MIDASELKVPSDFYSLHAVYLWLTTAEWLIGLAGVVICVHEVTARRVENSSVHEDGDEL